MSNVPSDPSCIFCKIAAGQIPAAKVYEDEEVLAFLDIGPLVTGHTLVIPKGHYATVMQTPAAVFAAGARIPKIAQAVLDATGAKACHVLINNGSEAMQSVHHLHWHILPRRSGDSFRIPWNAGKLDKEAASALAEAIRGKVVS